MTSPASGFEDYLAEQKRRDPQLKHLDYEELWHAAFTAGLTEGAAREKERCLEIHREGQCPDCRTVNDDLEWDYCEEAKKILATPTPGGPDG